MNLTDQEYKVAKLVILGKSSIEIAKELCISKRTVDAHRVRIMDKTDSNNITEAVSKLLIERISLKKPSGERCNHYFVEDKLVPNMKNCVFCHYNVKLCT